MYLISHDMCSWLLRKDIVDIRSYGITQIVTIFLTTGSSKSPGDGHSHHIFANSNSHGSDRNSKPNHVNNDEVRFFFSGGGGGGVGLVICMNHPSDICFIIILSINLVHLKKCLLMP